MMLNNMVGTLCVVMVLLGFSNKTEALAPPQEIERINLEAPVIVIGQVIGTGKAPDESQDAPGRNLFVVKVWHVVKGCGVIKIGDEVQVVYLPPPEAPPGLSVKVSGSLSVKVKEQDVVLVYLRGSRPSELYEPVAGGSSVVVIAPPKAE